MTAGHALKDARTNAGLTLEDVAFESRRVLPRVMWITKSKLSRVESGEVPDDRLDPHMVEFLCYLYGIDVAEFSPLIDAELKAYRRALKVVRSRCVSAVTQPSLPFDDYDPHRWAAELAEVRAGAGLDLRGDTARVLAMAS